MLYPKVCMLRILTAIGKLPSKEIAAFYRLLAKVEPFKTTFMDRRNNFFHLSGLYVMYIFNYLGTRTHITQTGFAFTMQVNDDLELLILLPSLSKCWDYKTCILGMSTDMDQSQGQGHYQERQRNLFFTFYLY